MFNWDSRSHIEEMADFRVERPEFIINWIGQAGFVFQTAGGAVICIDPYYSNSIERYEGRPARRMWYNKFKIANFRPDLVLCSHDHLDHTDPETLPLIYTYSDAVFAGPPSSISHMRRMRFCNERLLELKIGEKYRFRDVVYTPVFAAHTEDSMGFIFEIEGVKVYFTGDTSLSAPLFEHEGVDVLLACINAKYGNLTIEEAAVLYRRLGAKLLIPMHYGLIPNNTVDVSLFVQHYEEEEIRCLVMDVEQHYYFKKAGEVIEVRKEK
jgi:L-ascorbate metabolism protein UlaG (beta-lactamase superfamily)